MFRGCYTALITPFKDDGLEVDSEGLKQLVEFQIVNGVSGVLACGTTGESPTLDWIEHLDVTEVVCGICKGRCVSIAGTGSNCTQETLDATGHAVGFGANAVLLVDPYYNGPSSLEIRREYVAPVAEAFPNIPVIPYVIPGRTGTQLLPEDLAILHAEYSNVGTVKEATGDLENMAQTRACCGDDFTILSGDDDKTWDMMTNSYIRASGVISVASNIAPLAVQRMCEAILEKRSAQAEKWKLALQPLFDIVTVKTKEQTPYGPVICRARNPLATKTLMNILGMPSGPCRQPLGKMTYEGLTKVVEAAQMVHRCNPEILAPIGDFFDVDIESCLGDPFLLGVFCYESY